MVIPSITPQPPAGAICSPGDSIAPAHPGWSDDCSVPRTGAPASPLKDRRSESKPSCPVLPDAWPRLTPTGLPRPDPFPLDALPRTIADYVASIAQALPSPVDLVAVPALGAAAVAIGNALHLRVKGGWQEGARLWLLSIAPPGTKKSPALAAAIRPLREAQSDLHDAFRQQCNARAHEERASSPAALAAPPRLQQLYTSDTTREGLTALLADHPRGLALIADEGSGWIRSLNQYKRGKGDDRQFWLSLWSGSPLMVNRARDRGRPTAYVAAPMLSVLGCLPPTALRQLQEEAGREDGFIDRILFSWPDPVPYCWTDVEPEPIAQQAYTEMFRRLLALEVPMGPGTREVRPCLLGWTEGGRRAWLDYVRQLATDLNDPSLPSTLRGPWAKLEGYGARLALVLHVCRSVTGETSAVDVDEQSMRSAARLVAYFQAHARRVYSFLGQDRAGPNGDCRAVLEWMGRHKGEIASANPPRFSWRRIRRDLQNRFAGRAADLRQALHQLEEWGYLRKVETPLPLRGRPPEPDYWVHPEWAYPSPRGTGHF